MKAFFLIWFLFVGKFNKEQQLHISKVNNKEPITLTIDATSDTVSLNKPILITARLKNNTNKSVIIPSSFIIASNLFPNGRSTDTLSSGGLFTFNIRPTAHWASIHVENLAVQKPTSFNEIKAGKEIEFLVNLAEHINSFNREIRTDELKVKQGKIYSISLSYGNRWIGNQQVFVGKVKSNEIKLFIE